MSLNQELNPLVSIIIPVYNGSNYLQEAIDSALEQTYENIEIIVVNDGSKDDGKTEAVALSYGDKIRYFKKENGGVSSALNLGIEKMQGEYFSWLSHDDKYEPEKIEKQVDALMQTEDKMIAVCSGKPINENSELIVKHASAKRFEKSSVVSWNDAFVNLFNQGSFNGCAFLIHKSVFEKVGKFDENLRYVQDLLMWAKIFLNRFPLLYMQDELVLSRIHGGQLTQTGRELFHKESRVMADIIIPELLNIKCDCLQDLVYSYANYNATYNNRDVVKLIIDNSDLKLTVLNKFKIIVKSIYGSIRPLIRKVYYKLFLKVKTQ